MDKEIAAPTLEAKEIVGKAVIFHIDYKKVPNKILNEKTRKN